MPVCSNIAVIGLGYVGLPVAVALSKFHPVIGFDKNAARVTALQQKLDAICGISAAELTAGDLQFTDSSQSLECSDFFIIAVPTPIDQAKKPDLTLLLSATQAVAGQLGRGDIVVYESTVYPGVTENECVPLLEKFSGLSCGKDFNVGYSPERINPGDAAHDFSSIVKVVAAQNATTLDIIASVYQQAVTAGVFRASSIMVAEAAKVLENTQRDLNIALMNEFALICKKMQIDTTEVLAAASTKWNFLPFKPGLVGGHCIGVDPYYLTYCAEQVNYHPQVVLAGRRINDGMGRYVAEQTILQLATAGAVINNSRVVVFGLTFKENCADVRNTRVIDIIQTLTEYGVSVEVFDPVADANAAQQLYDIKLTSWENMSDDVSAIIIAVGHACFKTLALEHYAAKLNNNKLIVDVKSLLNREQFSRAGFNIWRL